ncbi:MAG: putative Mitogen-activated protein kinase kinase kinase 1 [Streblomastix strix]|uniref:Putative Mitogen-activated protein kinase kinase kinase 1 n=1 Tax=Streblomastix strix TaxID=222440 RepID=A0A5J4VVN2_9EUKA|nr:MAG: putative Mitogen-activated protein kinase kinase kinase 1 [Streblomastix strix]
MEYCNLKTLDIIAQQPQIHLPSYSLRALMKQILEGMRAFHSSGLVHRDIKCDNILLHSPPGSGRVYVKIADFGLAKKEDTIHEQKYVKGTLPFMSPELFLEKILISRKIDIYALGITFYKLITHKYPVDERYFKEQGKKIASLKFIERPSELKDDILWDLLSKLLEFDPNKRITAEQALEHPYFTSPEAIADISIEQQDLAQKAKSKKDKQTSKFDKIPSFIIAESTIKQLIENQKKEELEKDLNKRNIQQLKQEESEVYPSTQSSSEVYSKSLSSSPEVFPTVQPYSSDKFPNTSSSSSDIYPSLQQSSFVYPVNQSQPSEVVPSTDSCSSEVYPSTNSSSSEVYPNTRIIIG